MNVYALCSLAIMWVFSFFPPIPNPGAATMNWDILIFGMVVLLSVFYYVIRGRHTYDGPVEYVRKLD